MIDVPVDEWAKVVLAMADACDARDAQKHAPGQAPEEEGDAGILPREKRGRHDSLRGECSNEGTQTQRDPSSTCERSLVHRWSVTRQTLLTPEASNDFNLGIVNFSPGARNKMHTHSSDQVLFVTAGKGIIATETEQQIIVLGDVVHIPSEEKHWHGATPDSAFSTSP